MKSTALLKADHEKILEAVHVLAEIVDEVERGKAIPRGDLSSLLSYFREFADGRHHVKEEAIFFPALMQAGMTLENSPLRIMNYEHERGRTLTAAMAVAMAREKKEDLLMYARRYITLLGEHIEKENRVLFEIAEQVLADDEDERVAADFKHFEELTGGVEPHKMQRVIENLAAKYLHDVVAD
jgi:hemerythrin-like domain-containing protein